MRGVAIDNARYHLDGKKPWQTKIWCLFLNKVMDFTFQSEVVNTGSWISTEDDGNSGSFDCTSWEFEDLGATFLST
jgi:hypothetical protein